MIRGLRIGLRHVSEADLPLLIEAAGNPAVSGPFQASRMSSPQDVRRRFAETAYSTDDHETLLICDEAGAVIGNVLHFRAHRYASAREIGWVIFDAAHRCQGYATEAAQLLVNYLFENQPIHRLACGMVPQNMASRRVAEKCGFVYEGRARGLLFVGGEYLDGELFSMLRPEWELRRSVA